MSNLKGRFPNRVLSIFLAVLMVVGTLPVTAFAVTASEITTDIEQKSFKVGVPTEYSFTTVANDDAGVMVVGTYEFNEPDAIEKLEYLETQDGQWHEFSGDFGPPTGFPMSNATSRFRVTFKKSGEYSFKVSMKKVEDRSTLCSIDVSISVEGKGLSTLTTDIGEQNFVVGEPTEFSFTTAANDYAGVMVVGTSDFSDKDAIDKLEYYEVLDSEWHDFTGDFGPASGFPMGDATSRFRVTFKKAGDYTFTAAMKYADGENAGEVLCSSGQISLHVKDKYTVSVAKTGNGTVTLNGAEVGLEGFSAIEDTNVSLSVVPDDGWLISSVSIGGDSQQVADRSSFTKEISAIKNNIAIEVVFVKVYTVTVKYESAKGAVVTSPENTEGVVTVDTGTTVEITATPNETYRVSKVEITGKEPVEFSDNTYNTQNPYKTSLTADQDCTVQITFAPFVYRIATESTTNGSVQVDKDLVEYGNSVVVTMRPEAGYTIDTVTVNGENMYSSVTETEDDSVFEFSIEDIRADKNIAVTFKKCETATMEDVTWNSADALRQAENLYVFSKDATITFSTSKQGIRLTDENGEIYGDKDTNKVEIKKSTTIKKIEVRYSLGWHEVLVDGGSVDLKLVLDVGKPVANIKANAEANANGYYNSDISLTISAKDSGDFSGIDYLECRVVCDGSETVAANKLYTHADGEVKDTVSFDNVKIIAADNNGANVIVYAKTVDRAGNVSIEATLELKICTTIPSVSITFDDEQSSEADPDDNWYNHNRTATISINDRADVFDETAAVNGIIFHEKSKDGYTISEWTHSGTLHTATITFTDEGEYDWDYSYSNKADLDAIVSKTGNDTETFKIDRTAPFGTLTAQSAAWDGDGFDWSELLEKLTFGLYTNKNVTVGLKDNTASDLLSGFRSVMYYVSDSDEAMTESALKEQYESGAFVADRIEIPQDGQSGDAQFAVYARLVDNAGNVAYIGTNGVIYDLTASEIQIDVVDQPNENSMYGLSQVKEYAVGDTVVSHGIKADVAVSDLKTGTYYSGIKKVEYTVSMGSSQTQSGTLFEFKNAKPAKNELQKDWTGSVIIDADKNNGKNITLTIIVTDNAGNTSEESVTIKEINLDEITSTVTMTGKATEIVDGFGWYKAGRTAFITITDRASTFDAAAATAGIVFEITDKDGKTIAAREEDVSIGEWNNSGDLHTVTVMFNRDGKYSWHLDYTNKAGNKLSDDKISFGDSESPTAFTIDTVAPHGSLTVDGSLWTDKILSVLTFGIYSRTGFAVDMQAFDEENISPVKVAYYIYGGSEALGWSQLDALYNSDAFSETAPELTAEQQFTVYARITDYAGNYIYVSSDGHVIDATQTELEVDLLDQPNENGIYGKNNVGAVGDIASGIKVSVGAKEAESADDSYAGIQEIRYEVKSRNSETETYSITQSGTLYSFEYERASGNDSNGGKLTIKDVNSETKTYEIKEQVPTKEMLCREWAGVIVVDAEKNNRCDVAVVVYVRDNSGNETSQTVKLDVDITPPAITVTYDNNYAQNGSYFNAPRTATVVFTERDHHFNQAEAEKIITDTITATKLNGEEVKDAYTISWTSDLTSTQPDENTHTAIIAFEKDAHYTFGVSYTDLAGNVNDSVAPFDFTVDTTAPTGAVTVNGWTWTQLVETLTFGLYSNSTVAVEAIGEDEISPVTVEYYKSNRDFGISKVDVAELEFVSFEALEISEDEQFSIYVKVTDYAGNVTFLNSDGFIVDTRESEVSVTAVDKANENGIYGLADVKDYSEIGEAKQGIKVHIDVNEPDETANSGIASIEYSVVSELKGKNVTTQSGTLYSFDYTRTSGVNSNDGKLTVSDANAEKLEKTGQTPVKADLRTSWTGDIIVDAAANNSSKVVVAVTVKDAAGNTSADEIELDINMTTPTIDVTFDNNAVLNGTYFNAPRTATVVITERNNHFNSVAATEDIVITAKDAAGNDVENAYTISGWTDETHGSDPDATTHTATISFKADANYTFAISHTGKSGNPNAEVNTGDSVVPYQFTVDTTVPDASISINEHIWDKILNVLTFGLFSRIQAEVKIEAADKTSPITVEYYKTNDPIVKTENVLEELYKDGRFEPYEMFTVNTNEQFVIYVRITDNAGNYKYISSDGYIVDFVGPHLTLTPDEPNKNNAYNKDVNVQIEVQDDEPYSGIAKIEYWVVSDGKETQRQTLFDFDYTREEGKNTNKGTLVITDWADGTEKITTLTGNVPTQAQLYASWAGSFTVDASLNDSSDVKVYVGVTDNAGNYTEQTAALDIDITAPAIKVTYESYANEAAIDGYYTERTATVSITERTSHFDAAAATNGIKITAVDARGAAVGNAYVITSWATVEGETPDEAVHTAHISYLADANYTFSINYTDKADNKNVPVDVSGQKNPYQFTVDMTAPIGTVTAKSAEGREEIWSSIVDSLTFGFWSNTKISISGTSDDATSPVQIVEYYLLASEIASDNTTVLTKEELDAVVDWKAFDAFDVTENTQFTVYLKITDNAGNYTYISTNGLIVDEEHPIEESVAPEISVAPTKPINGIYSEDVKVAIEVVDPMVGGAYSGLKEVRYAVFDRDSGRPDRPTQEGTLFSFDVAYPKQSDLQQKWTGEITVSAAKNNSNNIQVVVYAVDNSLNAVDNSQKESKSYTVIKIDTTAPTIDIAYDNNDADSGTYFKANRTATVTVTERNFNADDVKISITNTDGVIPAVIGWSHTDGTYSRDDATHTATITYSSDGDYTFAMDYTDLAGNKCTGVNYVSGTVAGAEFTVDKTLPTVSVSYDNNSAANDKYFKENRTATITVVEHNFSTERVVFAQTASLSGSNISIPGASWSSNGDVHTAVISYTSDGDYTFDVTMTDLAGNASGEANYGNSVAAKVFTVDKTIVEPTIGGVENGVAYNGEVIPTIAFTDVNFATYEVRLLRTRFGDKDVDVTAQFLKGDPRNGSGVAGSYDYFESIAENDGIYTLTISVTDLAGNTSNSARTFTVNRFGSVYVYDDYLISLIKDGGQYIKKQDGTDAAITKDLVITEYNATRIAAGSLMVLITRNGEPIEAKYESNPVASPDIAVGESGWFQYLYTIDKSNFADEQGKAIDGEYRITISSRDDNDRPSTSVPENSIDEKNQAIKDTMNFTVDTTVPEIRNFTIPDAKFHDDYVAVNATSVNVDYSIVDVGGLKSVEVKVNGESRGVNTDFGNSLNTYDGTFSIAEANDRQRIEIIVEDLAGNITDTASGEFDPGEAYDFRDTILVSTNGFVRYYENKGLFYGSIGGVVGLAAVIWILVVLLKKKKKNNEER